ncbi:hypothetical protein [Vibrio maerlii]|uniref:hypothetical protein n=1 Tax=Vibrio maerlii TaxID=2231648 RepID=UPI000E3DD013|nr:hypothetical protein [Vibrio maerlii]
MTDKSHHASEPQEAELNKGKHSGRLAEAYKQEKRQLEIVEIEMNRAKIVIVDQEGKPVQLPLIKEH